MQLMLRHFSNAATRVSGNLNNTIHHNPISNNTSNGITCYFHYNPRATISGANSIKTQSIGNIETKPINNTHNYIGFTPSQQLFNQGNSILVRSLSYVPHKQLLINSNKKLSKNLKEAGGETLFELANSIISNEQYPNESCLELNKLDSTELESIYKKAPFKCIEELTKRKASGESFFYINKPYITTELKEVIDKIKMTARMPFDATFNCSGSLIRNYNTKLFYSDEQTPIALILDPKEITIYNVFIHSVATQNRLYLPESVDGKTKVWHEIIEDYVDYVGIKHNSSSEPELLLNDLQRNIEQILRNKFLTNSAQYGNVEDNFLKNQLQDNVNEILFLPKNPESLDYICEIAVDLSMRGEVINGGIERYLHQSEQIHLIEKIKTQFPDTPLSVIYTDSGNSSSKLVLKGIHQ